MRIGQRNRQKRSPGQALRHRWIFLLLCALVGTLLAVGVLLARPRVYESWTVVTYDPQRYSFVLQEEDGATRIHPLLLSEARELLSIQHPADLYGAPEVSTPVSFQRSEVLEQRPGDLVVIGRASQPERALEISSHGSTALSEAMRSIYGWDLLRTLLRREIYLQGQGRPTAATPLTPHLYNLMEAGFLSYDPAIPVSTDPPALTTQDVADVTLAVQRMEDRLTAQLNLLFEQRELVGETDAVAAIEREIEATNWRREQIRATLITLYRQGENLVGAPNGASAPQAIPSATAPSQPMGFTRWPFVLIGTAGGILLGIALALLDESMSLVGRLHELFAYKDLVWNLVMRDLKARYKSSILGYLWSLVNPLLMMVVFTILFKFLLKSEIANFPVFIIVALLPWNFCAAAVSASVVSVTGQSNLVKKVYFPREVLPIATVLSNLLNFLLALPAMFLIMVLLNAQFQLVGVLLPLIALIQTIFLLGMALLLSCLNVFFRDTQVIMEVVMTAWFFLTPIFYQLSDIVDEQLARLVRWFNPMAALVDFYRDIFYLGGMPGWDALIRTFVTACLVLLVGYIVFLRFSHRFGEEI